MSDPGEEWGVVDPLVSCNCVCGSKMMRAEACLPAAQEFGRNCFLIRNALSMEEQVQLAGSIHSQRQAMQEDMGALGLSVNDVSFDMDAEDMKPLSTSAPGKAISKAKDLIAKNCVLQEDLKPVNDFEVYCVDARFYGETQTLPFHCDGIRKENSVVFLFSLGRSASFYVHCPEMGGDRERDGERFEFNSGDLLFFDATADAGVYHGIESIGPASSCPSELVSLSDKRVGLQIRAR